MLVSFPLNNFAHDATLQDFQYSSELHNFIFFYGSVIFYVYIIIVYYPFIYT